MPSTLSDDTPSMKSIPIFMSVMACVGPNGTTTKTVNAASTTMNGAIQNTKLSASAGMMSSFSSSLMASAIGCSNHGDGEAEENKPNVHEGPKEIPRCAGGLGAVQVRGYVVDDGLHQRSTSP